MGWLLVIVGGLFETAFAVCLKLSEGFTRPGPVAGFAVAVALSMGLLGLGMRELPVGTAYAVWTGIGVAGTALVGIAAFGEAASALRLGAIGLILAGVVLLRVAEGAGA